MKKIVKPRFDDWISVKVTEDEAGKADYTIALGLGLEMELDKTRKENLSSYHINETTCEYCGGRTKVVDDRSFTYSMPAYREVYCVCEICGFWRNRYEDTIGNNVISAPLISQFDPENETVSLLHLSEEVSKNAEKIYSMDPRQFEVFVGSVISEHSDCEVYHVGGTGDDGVDLIAIVSDRPNLIQVKRRADPQAVEGIDVVKLLFASAFGQGQMSGTVITSAQRFSKPAKEWSRNRALKDLRFDLELLAINDLIHMVDAVAGPNEDPPWIKHSRFLKKAKSVNWRLHNLEDGVLLVGADDGTHTAIVIDRSYVERYFLYVVSSVEFPQALPYAVKELKDALSQKCRFERCLSQNYDFFELWGIPVEVEMAVEEKIILWHPEGQIKQLF
ncbi:MAG: restriction endonuclease [Pseudomonadota bacterium]